MRRQPRTELLDELARVPLFAGLWRRDLLRVAAAVEVVDVDAGTEVVRQSDAGHDLYVVVQGSATVVEDGRPAAMLGPGDTFGETGVFAGARHPATVVAADPLRLAVLGRRAAFGLLHVVPQLAPHLLRGMAARLGHRAETRVGAAARGGHSRPGRGRSTV
ncbi:MAG: cyclic nucleotide-binding domain-containing protein [Acidimicrobiia bacterium]